MAKKPKQLDPIHPGEIQEFMRPMAIRINRLAREICVPPGRISAVVNAKRSITTDRTAIEQDCGRPRFKE